MSLSTVKHREDSTNGFGSLLKTWRQKRRLSQLDLALSSGVSQRHVSFLESGRAQPSRSMILQLSETLDVPLRERNAWLAAAGFAPMFKARTLDDPQMSQIMSAVQMMLTNHEPFPAIAIDRAWNIRMSNGPFDMMCAMISPDMWEKIGGHERNLMRLLFHPNGIKAFVTNWSVVAPLLWHRAQREAEALGGYEMKQVLLDLAQYQDADTLWSAEDAALLPILPMEIAKDGVHVALFTVIATFGTAQDVTTDELRIETLFPADEETELLFRSAAAG
ncbi:MAG TPA: helix-turn-helix transcriptional regulator [Rhizomicrobium sp.]|nr:helix-turn-helix transcriptional regulator [Rhizomicrobium sp.]